MPPEEREDRYRNGPGERRRGGGVLPPVLRGPGRESALAGPGGGRRGGSHLQHADDSAGHPGAGVARLQAVRESSLAEVVLLRVNDNGPSQDGVRPRERDDVVCDGHERHSLGGGVDVAQVADVSLGVDQCSVALLQGQNRMRGAFPAAREQRRPLTLYGL